MIVTEDGELADGVYDTPHEPAESVHEDALNVPPVPPSLQDIEPVGVEAELETSDTVDVKDIDDTDVTDVGFAFTERVVVSGVVLVLVELL
ncbi:hypothetical protein NSIN_30107 [Nitrosotalea sinensis]|uniref:Uncharacterized protein n=1 Tax=Nitrosotalea sinensis TaxID=1499975 RepID=A0A2H1EHW4_9ARCH|nr:hypothetical protein NSIN_30107 [Candidatus Nitrosotalea sinensis]